MKLINRYFKNLFDTLVYFDFQPLLFFWVTSDILNNQVLWTTHAYWVEVGQGSTYFLYLAYLIISLFMLLFIHNYRKMVYFIGAYLTLYLFSTIRYLVSIYINDDFTFKEDFRALLITMWYASMWTWIWIKIKNENFHKKLRDER